MPLKFNESKGLDWKLFPVNIAVGCGYTEPDIERLNKKKFRALFNMPVRKRKELRFKLP